MSEEECIIFDEIEPSYPALCIYGPLALLGMTILSVCCHFIPGLPDICNLAPLLLTAPGLILLWIAGVNRFYSWKTNGEYGGHVITGILLLVIDTALISAILLHF